MLAWSGRFLLPAEGEICGRDYLDEIHEIECLLVCALLGVVQGIDVMVGPSTWSRSGVLLLHILNNSITELGSKAEVVDPVCESVRVLVLDVVVQIMYVQISIGERFPRSNVEVTNNLVHPNAAFKTTSLLALLVEVLSVVFALALLHTLAATKGP